MLKHSLHVQYGCGKWFEVAVCFNHDVMTSFWLHKWPRWPNPQKTEVVQLYKAAAMCLWTINQYAKHCVYLSLMDVGSSLRWLSASTMAQWHHFDFTSDPNGQNLCQLGCCNWIWLLPFAYGQYINMQNCCVYLFCGCGKQFEVDVSLNYDVMTSFWLHEWPKLPKPGPTGVL
jgi:hypothetical protein